VKLSCLPVSFYPELIAGHMRLGEWARMGAELGLDAVDVSVLFFADRSPRAVARARQEVEEQGISLGMMSTYPDFTHPDPTRRAYELDAALEALDLAANLGVRYLRAIAGQAHPETGRQEGIGWAVEGLQALVEASRGSGVAVVYENHDQAGVMAYLDFSAPPEVFLAICQATAKAGLGINFDTANAVVHSPDPLALLDQVIDRVVTVHASDTRSAERLAPAVIGAGVVPFAPLFERLCRAGWDNWLCIEEASGQGRAGVEAAVQYIRQAWAEARQAVVGFQADL
jgi:sugar phosphate isomerase/epimerase